MDGGHKVDLDAGVGLIGSDGGFHAAGLRSGFHESEELGVFLGKERGCGCAQEEKADPLADLSDKESHNRFGCFAHLLLAIHFGDWLGGAQLWILISPQSKEKTKASSAALLKSFGGGVDGKKQKNLLERGNERTRQQAPARPLLQQENKVFLGHPCRRKI